MATEQTLLRAAPGSAVWEGLRSLLRGDVVLPSDAGYGFARQLQNKEYDVIGPQAVAYCESPYDLRACVRFAQEHDVPLHTRSGGHSFNGWSTGPGLVVDLSRINHVLVCNGSVRLGAGTQSVDALDVLRPTGTQLVTGTFPTVSAGGFLSGGGLGWQTRKFGVGSDRVVSARVLLADGRVIRCSATHDPDLYWAVRGGGGGNFGIVVDFDVRPIDAPLLVGYDTMWDFGQAADVLAGWQEWCASAPNDLGSSLVVLPQMFSPHDDPIINVWGAHHGTKDELEGLLDELAERVGARPVKRTVGEPLPYSEVMHERLCDDKSVAQCHRTGHNPLAVGHRHPFTRQSYALTNRPVTRDEANRLLDAWDPRRDNERYLLCIALGGVANEVGRTESAYVHRDAQFLTGYQMAVREDVPAPETVADLTAWADGATAALAPIASGAYINFPSSRTPENWGAAYYGENHPRLLDIKRQYDPDNFFRHSQSIGS
ncbi:FAD-binding oxidoreductase [Streptomyces sp. NPDC006733]|uniref:FAD-binding oxidoreductase n=1 Tax=Streptomyces sp. NPDC006733 TaxID=3155460 RepID=UPI0033D3D8A4